MKKVIVLALTIGLLGPAAWADLEGPTPYLQFSGSPFDGLGFDWFYLENFEDGALNVPGVTANTGYVVGPGGNTDSVDEDADGVNGSGTAGRSFFNQPAAPPLVFTFNANVLGTLPTHAGIVWTDGINPIVFEAFDAGGSSLGQVIGNHAVFNSYGGQTDSDRFYGAVDLGGISRIEIKSGIPGGIEVDHLQYGAIPVPGAVLLGAMGLGMVGWMKRRKKEA